MHFAKASQISRVHSCKSSLDLWKQSANIWGLEVMKYLIIWNIHLLCSINTSQINAKISLCTQNVALRECHFCRGPLRRVKSDGSAVYMNGDRTTTPVEGQSHCRCGFKHYWNGREYDNMPERSDLLVIISVPWKTTLMGGCLQRLLQFSTL